MRDLELGVVVIINWFLSSSTEHICKCMRIDQSVSQSWAREEGRSIWVAPSICLFHIFIDTKTPPEGKEREREETQLHICQIYAKKY